VNFNISTGFHTYYSEPLSRAAVPKKENCLYFNISHSLHNISRKKNLGRNISSSIFSVVHSTLYACWSTHAQLYSTAPFALITLSLPQWNYINFSGKK